METSTVKERKDPFKNVVLAAALTDGFKLLNVLVIADSLEGMLPVMASQANCYYFTDCDKSRGRHRQISRIKDYAKLLDSQFDVVISRQYQADHYNFVKYNGLYLTMHEKPETIDCHYEPDTKCVALSHSLRSAKKTGYAFIETIKEAITRLAKQGRQHVYVPDIDKVKNVSVNDAVTITHKGVKADPFTTGLMDMYNKCISIYNPLYTTYTGVIDAFHKFPSTAFVDLDERVKNLKEFGFKITADEKVRMLSERTANKYRYLTTPLMPLLPQQTLGYIKEGDATAKASVKRLGIVKGKTYPIRVGWQKRIDTTPDHTVKRGYMTVKVNGHTLFEDREEDVTDYISAFGLPKIASMADTYAEDVTRLTKRATRLFPKMEPVQVEGVALLATKACNHLGDDTGFGKSFESAAWAKIRQYRRVLITAQRQYLDKWAAELDKFGFTYEWLIDWQSVGKLKERIKSGVKYPDTTFFLCSFEFLGLQSDIRMDPWTCTELDKRGYIEAVIKDIKTTKCPSCGKTVGQARKVCPKCGSTNYSGRYCKDCKTPSYTYKRHRELTPAMCEQIERDHRAGRSTFNSGTYPAYKKLKKLFSAVIVDEAQMIKNPHSLRSEAVRSLHSKGKLLVTATLMKNWPSEIYWPLSWMLGFNNPMFPYKYRGGYAFFTEQFGTELYKGIGKDQKPDWDRIPEVSNLTILWKLLAPIIVRRLKTDIEGVTKPDISKVMIQMDDYHEKLYQDVRQSKLDDLSKELLKENPDSRIIGANLWSLRGASTVPVAGRYFPQVPTTYSGTWNKLKWVVDKARELQAEHKKVLVFSTLVDMADAVHQALNKAHVSSTRIQLSTKNRFEAVSKFNTDSTTALVSSTELIGRCYDIENANVVIFTDCGWTPEEHEQAMNRAQRIWLSMAPIKVYFLLNHNTIDEHMYDLVVQKGEAIKNVLDRRAVYKPVEALIEAIQVKVAKAIVAEKYVIRRKTAPEILPVKPAEAPVMDVWKPIPVMATEQLSLFGEAASAIKVRTKQGKAA